MSQHLSHAQSVAAGLRSLPALSNAFACTQAAWRFYSNPRLNYQQLAAPLIECGRSALKGSPGRYALIVHDWSQLDYTTHTKKTARKVINNRKVFGYDLQTALLISSQTGDPITPLCQCLYTRDGVQTTRCRKIEPPRSKLDELSQVIHHVETLRLGKRSVHIVDRGADSVLHFREWIKEGWFFIVRGNDWRLVSDQGEVKTLRAVVDEMERRQAFRFTRFVKYQGQTARQYISETDLILDRAARARLRRDRTASMSGEAIQLRLIVSRIKNEAGELLSEWLLWTDLGRGAKGVSAPQVAEWYYWRWKIENYFKLLKSAGHNLEQWQQEKVEGLLRRLLVVGMSCVVVWHLGRAKQPGVREFRRLLVRLSGRQMKKSKEFTDPALLSGLGALLSMLDVLEVYDVQELRRQAMVFLPWAVGDG